MANVNIVLLAGNLTAAPEMRYTPSGTPVTNFSVATSRKWTNPDGSPGEETVWFRVTAWKRMAETCNQYLAKGRLVLVDGGISGDRVPQAGGSEQIVPHIWQGQDGQPRAQFGITAQTVRFLGGRGEAPPSEVAGAPTEEPPEEGEEIPF